MLSKSISPKVSVIVPVYNAEKYLRRALDSLRMQTMQDFEIILINDGSSDLSSVICNEYVDIDCRFSVIHKQNAGVSAARQDGLERAKGEYVIHVDSDDWVEPNMLEELYKKAKQDDADIVICDYFNNIGTKQTICRQCPSSLEPKQILQELFQQLHGSCWNKLARRACYKQYGIQFPCGINYCEDLFTWVQFLSHEEVKVAYLNKAFYHYCDNPESITRSYQRSQYETRCKFVHLLEKVLPSDLKSTIVNKVKFDIFIEANIFDVLTRSEIKDGLKVFKCDIANLGKRWRIGFILLSLGLNKIAHKFLKY